MIRATNKFGDNPLVVKYVDLSREIHKPIRVARNAKGNLLVSGYAIGTYPRCDGEDLCGKDARYVITIQQFHDVSFQAREVNTTTIFRNFMLLCPSCLSLYQHSDTMIGSPIDLADFTWMESNTTTGWRTCHYLKHFFDNNGAICGSRDNPINNPLSDGRVKPKCVKCEALSGKGE